MRIFILNILLFYTFFSLFGKATSFANKASETLFQTHIGSSWSKKESKVHHSSFIIHHYFTDTSFQLLHTIPIKSTYSTVDNLQNLYVANIEGQVYKYDNKGRKQFIYNNKRLGQVGKIDARNPFNILVYYPDFEVVVILDRTLSVISELNLFDLDILEPKGVCLANDNNIWVFDQVRAVLKKIDQKSNVLFESRNLNQLTKQSINATFLVEKENLLWLSDLENGLFVFDTFGQLKQEIAISSIEQFQVIDQQVIYWREKQLYSYDLGLLKEQAIKLPISPTNIQNIRIQGDLIFITEKESITIYRKKNKDLAEGEGQGAKG